MLFPTVQFALFFPVVLALSWALMPRPKLWKPFILAASYVFYAAASWRFCLLLGGRDARQPGGGARPDRAREDERRAQAGRRRRRSRSTSACSAVFKYYGFFVADIGRRARPRRARAAAAAADDRAAGRASASSPSRRSPTSSTSSAGSSSRRSTLDFAIYLSFFPHLVAGPIVRAREFLPQLAEPRDPNRVAVGVGAGADRARAGQEGGDRRLPRARGRRPGLRGARRPTRRRTSRLAAYALHGADLLRLLRLHRHRDRPRAADGLRVPAELPQPVPRARASATSGAAGT